MLVDKLIKIDTQLEEKSYLEAIANALQDHFETSIICMEINPCNRAVLPYAYVYAEQPVYLEGVLPDEMKSGKDYSHIFAHLNGTLLISFSTIHEIPEVLTSILEHFITFYTLGKLSCNVNIDTLTGVSNRRCLSQYLTSVGSMQGLIVLDIDNFKGVNDTYGHLIGDSVLEELGHLLLHNCSAYFVPYRYGGDEFIIIPNAYLTETQLIEFAESLCAQFGSSDTAIKYGLSMSLGVYHESQFDPTYTLSCTDIADKALYLSKYLGKGRVTLATPSKMLFFDARYKLKEMWLSLERVEVTNTVILLQGEDTTPIQEVASAIASKVRKLDIISTFGKSILIVFDNEVSDDIFKHKYQDVLDGYAIRYTYVDFRTALNYYKFIAFLDKEGVK